MSKHICKIEDEIQRKFYLDIFYVRKMLIWKILIQIFKSDSKLFHPGLILSSNLNYPFKLLILWRDSHQICEKYQTVLTCASRTFFVAQIAMQEAVRRFDVTFVCKPNKLVVWNINMYVCMQEDWDAPRLYVC